jgi:hypothetical protein
VRFFLIDKCRVCSNNPIERRYGGIFEKGSKEYTLDDFHLLQLDKLDKFTCLKESAVLIPDAEEESSSDEDEDEESGSGDDDDEDDEGQSEGVDRGEDVDEDKDDDEPKRKSKKQDQKAATEVPTVPIEDEPAEEVPETEDPVSQGSSAFNTFIQMISERTRFVLEPMRSWEFPKTRPAVLKMF